MFSFFKKKPTGTTSDASADSGVERPRGALDWLNADVGELFFGKKNEGEARDAPATIAAAPAASPAAAQTSSPAPAADAPIATDRAGWLAKLKGGLQRTGGAIAGAFIGAEIGDDLWEDLEVALLQADTGAEATLYLLDELQARVTRAHIRDPAAARRLLARCVEELLQPLERPLVIGAHTPTVVMVVGVNGAGKTTSVGKLARHLIDAGQKVLLAAADTFRAAAREQLLAWAERAGAAGPGQAAGRIEIVSQEGGDPAGVTFDAVVAGKARGSDVVIVDTAGRLATQAHLMEELKKIKRVIGKAEAGAPHEILLVIDGNTGQNALTQVQAFDEALQLTGLVITKLDGTAKGGVLAAIALWSRARAAPLPVYFVGVGEKLADLQTFRAREFADALIG
jgi:fused signal recognition particle receptor